MSLRDSARALAASPDLVWRFFEAEAEDLPDDLNFDPIRAGPLVFAAVDVGLDGFWSFVRRQANKHRVWFALDADTRQAVAFHIGDRGKVRA